ncbi:hypothetical protein SBC1_44980 (plasmid) [Caballeronia sp. SBC1]|nr:hypothetical protein SBC2_42990 [Caballeronia sp. SBC2]QIN64458.1 hypothetical protein SBC1_44980 [Caballeronia sp. SBC1]
MRMDNGITHAAAVSCACAQGEVEHDDEAAAVRIVHGQVAAASGIDSYEGP